MRLVRLGAVLALAWAACGVQAARNLEVMSFPGGFNWPFWVGAEKGFFAAEALDVKLTPAPGSVVQMKGLAEGKFDIAISTMTT